LARALGSNEPLPLSLSVSHTPPMLNLRRAMRRPGAHNLRVEQVRIVASCRTSQLTRLPSSRWPPLRGQHSGPATRPLPLGDFKSVGPVLPRLRYVRAIAQRVFRCPFKGFIQPIPLHHPLRVISPRRRRLRSPQSRFKSAGAADFGGLDAQSNPLELPRRKFGYSAASPGLTGPLLTLRPPWKSHRPQLRRLPRRSREAS
jgi:hypothetical protein